MRIASLTVTATLTAFVLNALGADSGELELEKRFAGIVHPFLEAHCFNCHGKEKPKAQLDLTPFSTMKAVVADYPRWELVLEKLAEKEMPPEEAKHQPSGENRQAVIDWIRALRKHEAERNAGDPGPVLARRLSNAEYDYTIRDLTGADIRPTREFPVDPANQAGFDNSGESLSMSPGLLRKYLEAARHVAEHIVLKPQGLTFAPHPVVTETDRDKYCVQRIVDFYKRQPTDYADYFMAAWRYGHRAALGKPEATLVDIAREQNVSPQYLAIVWSALAGTQEEFGPMAKLQVMWRELPSAEARRPDLVRNGCEQMRAFALQLRQRLKPEFKNLSVRGVSSGSQPLVLWKDRQYATNRMRYSREAFISEIALKSLEASTNAARRHVEADSHFQIPTKDFGFELVRFITQPATNAANAQPNAWDKTAALATTNHAVVILGDDAARSRCQEAFERFCRIFPDAFYVSERGRIFLQKDEGDRGRLLSAGFHLMVGYFRDDAPLYELVLDEKGQREIDGLWQELNFITFAPLRQYKDFIFFERAEPPRFAGGAEFDFARSEDKDSASAAKIQQMAETYLAKARRVTNEGPAIDAIKHYFKSISSDIRRVEETRLAAEQSHREALLALVERAYRRPLSQTERNQLLSFYVSLREKENLDHEEAIRDTLVSALMSPHFCYHVDSMQASGASLNVASSGILNEQSLVASAATRQGRRVIPLSDYALASRLSYFLWASMPDEELLARAAAGDLRRPEILTAQARRMLRDSRVRGLATEFGGNWLDFRRFEEHNSVDRERFKSFNNELRQAMFEEPIRFFVQLVRDDRPVLDFLYADYAFANPILAKHYGMPGLNVESNDWVQVNEAHQYGRGGLLPMSVFLTKNAPGLRTSPVKRGYWVVRRLLGENIPPPPPTVPELPNDESKLGDLTLREMLAKHREDKSCAGCHKRFDSFGLVFEGYGPIGERRTMDLGGRPVDIRAEFPGGSEGVGLNGLRDYLRIHRQDDFLDNLCRKLLAYALGRTLLISDDAAIREMRTKLAANGNRFSSLIESIVASPQFLNKRAEDNL